MPAANIELSFQSLRFFFPNSQKNRETYLASPMMHFIAISKNFLCQIQTKVFKRVLENMCYLYLLACYVCLTAKTKGRSGNKRLLHGTGYLQGIQDHLYRLQKLQREYMC